MAQNTTGAWGEEGLQQKKARLLIFEIYATQLETLGL